VIIIDVIHTCTYRYESISVLRKHFFWGAGGHRNGDSVLHLRIDSHSPSHARSLSFVRDFDNPPRLLLVAATVVKLAMKQHTARRCRALGRSRILLLSLEFHPTINLCNLCKSLQVSAMVYWIPTLAPTCSAPYSSARRFLGIGYRSPDCRYLWMAN
jgi:hypothetical protein